jgi:hypothetical protein
MKNYSIVRIGKEYVVRTNEQSVLKFSSRRKAVELVADAAELLDSQPAPPTSPDVDAPPSIARDRSKVP